MVLRFRFDHDPIDVDAPAAAVGEAARSAARHVRPATFTRHIDHDLRSRITEHIAKNIAKRSIHGRLLPSGRIAQGLDRLGKAGYWLFETFCQGELTFNLIVWRRHGVGVARLAAGVYNTLQESSTAQ